MKNTVKLIGIALIVAAIVFMTVSCNLFEANLKVVNETTDVTITDVKLGWADHEWHSLSIKPGTSSTINLGGGGGSTTVTVTFGNNLTRSKSNVQFDEGSTTTVTLSGSSGSYTLK